MGARANTIQSIGTVSATSKLHTPGMTGVLLTTFTDSFPTLLTLFSKARIFLFHMQTRNPEDLITFAMVCKLKELNNSPLAPLDHSRFALLLRANQRTIRSLQSQTPTLIRQP